MGEIHALEAGSNTAVIVIARAGLGRVRAAGRGAAGEGVFDKAVHSGLAEVIRTTHCPNTCDPPEAAGGSPAPKMPPLPPPPRCIGFSSGCQPSVGAEPPTSPHWLSLVPLTTLRLFCMSVSGAFTGVQPPEPKQARKRLTMKYSMLHYHGTLNINQIYCWAPSKPPYVRASERAALSAQP